MRKHCIFIVLVAVFFGCRTEEKVPPAEVETFLKLIGHSDYPLDAVDARMDNGGNIIMLANVEFEDEGVFAFTPMIIRVDENGNLIGEKDGLFYDGSGNTVTAYSGEIEASMISHSLTRINDNSYLVVGEVINGSTSFVALATYDINTGFKGPFLITVDDQPVEGSGRTSVIITPSDDYFIVGTNGTNSMVFEVESNALDDVSMTAPVPTGRYGLLADSKSNVLNRSFQNVYGKISFAGPTNFSGPGAQVTEFNPAPEAWKAENSYNYPLNATTITFTAFLQNYPENIIAGTVPDGDETRSEIMLFSGLNPPIKLTNSAVINREGNETPVSISNSDNGFVVLGVTEEGNGEEDYFLMKFQINKATNELDLDFIESFGGENADIPKTVLSAPDGGFVMFGYTEFSDVNTLLLIKCDRNGGL